MSRAIDQIAKANERADYMLRMRNDAINQALRLHKETAALTKLLDEAQNEQRGLVAERDTLRRSLDEARKALQVIADGLPLHTSATSAAMRDYAAQTLARIDGAK